MDNVDKKPSKGLDFQFDSSEKESPKNNLLQKQITQ